MLWVSAIALAFVSSVTCAAKAARVARDIANVGWAVNTTPPSGVEFVSVATAIDPRAPNFPPADWLHREDWPVATIWDDAQSSVLSAFGASAFPFWVFTDADGAVALRTAGSLGVEQLETIMVGLGN